MGDTRIRVGESRVTSQGQISVPAEVRRRLGIRPGTTLVWELDAGTDEVALRPKRVSLVDVQKILASAPSIRRTDREVRLAREEAWLQRWKRAKHVRGGR